MAFVTGQVLNNRYRVVRLLREGGFGTVYRAWDLNLKRPCAIKVNRDTTPAAEEQFFREAAMLANLSHPNLPRVTDHFIIKDMGQFLVMDYVEGEDLQDLLDRSQGGLPLEQALTWIRQVGDALGYLHSRKPPVIHRDLKPANIRITPEGKAVLVDFGIAKEYEANMATAVVAKAVTPGYSPPEQYSGVGTDQRSDIYAFGATVYNQLTGQVPPESTLRMANTDKLTPPRFLNPNISVAVEAAILQAVDVNRDLRFHRVEDFLAALSKPAGEVVAATQVMPRAAEGAMAATVAAPDGYGPTVYPNAAGGYGSTAYPDASGRSYQPEAQGKAKGGFPVWAVAVAGAVGLFVILVLAIALLSGGDLFGGDDDKVDYEATDTRRAALVLTDQARKRPTNTPRAPEPTNPPQATYTPYPTYTKPPNPTNTPRSPDPTDTRPPPPTNTSAPVQTNVKVQIRNRTGNDANLYRIGLSGERHFLGWLVHNYYGIYTFPSLGQWTVEFCARDSDGNSYNCRRKTINVTSSGQEFSVP